MEQKHIWSGAVLALIVFGVYFTGSSRRHGMRFRWREWVGEFLRPVTRRGLLWAVTLPVLWIGIYAAFIAHVRLGLGRWPAFGESLPGPWLRGHYEVVMGFLGALVGSLFVAGAVLAGCLFSARWRHVSLYAVCYGVAVAAAFGSLFLAPGPFLNWLLD